MVNPHEPQENFRSERRFEIWDYTASHSQLLLRGAKTNLEQTRIDVLFKGVTVMNLPTYLDGISIEKSSGDFPPQLTGIARDGCSLYRVLTGAFEGYVVAAAMFVHADDLDFNEPSRLFVRMLP
jgi:hypothetical protein